MKWGIRDVIGPGFMMVGAAIGGGEWLMGPTVTAKYGANPVRSSKGPVKAAGLLVTQAIATPWACSAASAGTTPS